MNEYYLTIESKKEITARQLQVLAEKLLEAMEDEGIEGLVYEEQPWQGD